MAAHICERIRARVYDCLLGGVPIEPSRFVWFGLSLGAANAAGLVVEPPRSAGYRRIQVRNDERTFPPHLACGVKANARSIVFPPPTADWGVVRSVFVADGDADDWESDVLAMIDAPILGGLRVDAGDPPVTIPMGSFVWA